MNKDTEHFNKMKEDVKNKIMNYGIRIRSATYHTSGNCEYKRFMYLLSIIFYELHNEILEELFRSFTSEDTEAVSDFPQKHIEFLKKCSEEISKNIQKIPTWH